MSFLTIRGFQPKKAESSHVQNSVQIEGLNQNIHPI